MANKKDPLEDPCGSAGTVWPEGLGTMEAAHTQGERMFHTLVRRGPGVEKDSGAPRKAARKKKPTAKTARKAARSRASVGPERRSRDRGAESI